MSSHAISIGLQGIEPLFFNPLNVAAAEAATHKFIRQFHVIRWPGRASKRFARCRNFLRLKKKVPQKAMAAAAHRRNLQDPAIGEAV